MAVFDRDASGAWIPSPLARGPFAGLQGGAVAALMTAEIEQIAAGRGLGRAVGVSAWFVRPAPMAPLRTRPDIIHARGRLALIDNAVFADDPEAPFAMARVSVLADRALEAEPYLPPSRTFDPGALHERRRVAPHGGAWFMDAMEARRGADGVAWFRMLAPIIDGAGPLAGVLGPADWAHGIARPIENRYADPNPDLHVHLLRPPSNGWIGVQASASWRPEVGAGVGWATLLDPAGEIGCVSMSVALAPFPQPAPALSPAGQAVR